MLARPAVRGLSSLKSWCGSEAFLHSWLRQDPSHLPLHCSVQLDKTRQDKTRQDETNTTYQPVWLTICPGACQR